MKYHKLGQTDITVSELSLGCWAFGGGPTWGDQDEADSIATVHAALDLGVNFFDTAEGYGAGASELVLGRALQGRRDQAIIATKVSRSHLGGSEVQRACERSLHRLQTDYIDLYQVHWPSRSVPLDETLTALEKLREQGKVRALGVCNFGVQDLNALLALGLVETNQLPYSLVWRAIEFEIKQKCLERDLGILCYSPLAQALLTGKYATPGDVPAGRSRSRLFSSERPNSRHNESGAESELFEALAKIQAISSEIGQLMANVSLAWLLHQTSVTSVIVGARNPDQIRQTVQAVDVPLSPAVLHELTVATEDIKQKLGPNPDFWQTESRFR